MSTSPPETVETRLTPASHGKKVTTIESLLLRVAATLGVANDDPA